MYDEMRLFSVTMFVIGMYIELQRIVMVIPFCHIRRQ